MSGPSLQAPQKAGVPVDCSSLCSPPTSTLDSSASPRKGGKQRLIDARSVTARMRAPPADSCRGNVTSRTVSTGCAWITASAIDSDSQGGTALGNWVSKVGRSKSGFSRLATECRSHAETCFFLWSLHFAQTINEANVADTRPLSKATLFND